MAEKKKSLKKTILLVVKVGVAAGLLAWLVRSGKLEPEKIWEAIVHFRQTLTPEDDETPRCTYALAAALARVGIWEEALKYMVEAQEKARARGQLELLASIERDLRRLEQDGNR